MCRTAITRASSRHPLHMSYCDCSCVKPPSSLCVRPWSLAHTMLPWSYRTLFQLLTGPSHACPVQFIFISPTQVFCYLHGVLPVWNLPYCTDYMYLPSSLGKFWPCLGPHLHIAWARKKIEQLFSLLQSLIVRKHSLLICSSLVSSFHPFPNCWARPRSSWGDTTRTLTRTTHSTSFWNPPQGDLRIWLKDLPTCLIITPSSKSLWMPFATWTWGANQTFSLLAP